MFASSKLSKPLTGRSAIMAIAIVVGVVASTLSSAEPASAALFRYKVIEKSSTANVTGGVFASCKITTNGGACDIARGKSITRTIGISLGASRSVVSSGLSISAGNTVTTTVACQSPALKAGQTWHGRALGTRYNYKVQKQQSYKPRVGATQWKAVGTSSKLTAFDPKPNSISCGL